MKRRMNCGWMKRWMWMFLLCGCGVCGVCGETADDAIGEEPDIDLYRIFLRNSILVLKPGEYEVEVDVSYSKDEYYGVSTREITVPLIFRAGLTHRLEGSIEVPYIWKERQKTQDGQVSSRDDSGAGDLTAGLKYNIFSEKGARPDTVLTLTAVAPTGNEPDYRDVDSVNLGNGHWRLGAGINAVKSSDPVVMFAGAGYTYVFDETMNGVEVHQGGIFNYNFGMGFSINHKVTVSGQFLGAYEDDIELDGEIRPGTSTEPMSLRAGVTYRMANSRYLEPSVTYGLNDDATDVILNLSFSQQF